MFVWVCISIVGIILLIKFLYKIQHGKCVSDCRLDGKLAIITGASSGIGMETAMDFAHRGARVIMACRNADKAQKIADAIIRSSRNTKVEVQVLDTSSLASVRSFANHILKTEEKLHILVNNAATTSTNPKVMTDDGLELTMATNHYGHFLLANMLGGLLKAGAPSRVVCVSSSGHLYVKKFDPEDMNFRCVAYGTVISYGYSKLCNVLMAKEMAKRLQGTGVTSYSVHPGLVSTEIYNKSSLLYMRVLGVVTSLMGKDASSGAQTTIYCAVDAAAGKESGLYYADCKVEAPSELGRHGGLASKMWTASELDVKLRPEEANI